jgi:rubredoxin
MGETAFNAALAGSELPENDDDRYQCQLCSYIYDPKVGDPTADIPQDTPFRELPDDWVCPECGAAKDQFVRLET